MAIVTGIAVVGITLHAVVRIVNLISVAVFVAIDATENAVIAGISMTIAAKIPFIAVFAGIDGEILLIVIKC